MCCSAFHHNQSQDSLSLVNTSFGEDGFCRCLGQDADGNPVGYCCGFATQDDGLCDRCRIHCGTDHHHEVVAEHALLDDRRVEVASVS